MISLCHSILRAGEREVSCRKLLVVCHYTSGEAEEQPSKLTLLRDNYTELEARSEMEKNK